MNALRKILVPLLLIPAGMLVYVFLYPEWQWESPGLEYLFLLIGVPILGLNFMAWFYPDILQAYFPVKEWWEEKSEKAITFAMVISALTACICVSAGAVVAGPRVNSRPVLRPSAVQPVTATAFARSIQVLSSATDSSERIIVSTPRPALEVDQAGQPPAQTPQIPVSGGIPTRTLVSPTDSSALSIAVAPTEASATTTSMQPTGTVAASARCTPASPEYLEALLETVQDADPENVVTAGWMVQPNGSANLWFVGARIESDTETTLPGVWAFSVYPDESYDLYAINDIAFDLSYADSGEDSDPVLTMQSDGAQAAYDCAAPAQ